MAELTYVVEGKQLAYNGLFRTDELYNLIKQNVLRRGYYIIEKKNQEDILENGKQVIIELQIEKTLSDYAKAIIRLRVFIKGLKDKTITIDNHKQKYQQGEVQCVFFALTQTDYRNKWEGKGAFFLFRTLMDKFVRHDVTHKMEEELKSDCIQLADEIKSYLNMSRFKISHDMHPHVD